MYTFDVLWSQKSTTHLLITNFQQQFQAQLQESQQRVIQLQQAVQQNQLAQQQQMANQFNQQQNQAVGQQNVPNPALGQQFDSRYQGAGGNQVIQNQNANQFGQNLPPNNQHKDVDLRFLNKQSLVCMLNFIKSMISTSH